MLNIMKIIKTTILLSFIFFTPLCIKAQQFGNFTKQSGSKSGIKLIEKGNKLFNELAYDEAIKVYLKAINKKAQSSALYANLADSYYQNTDMQNAVKWYRSLMNYDLASVKGEYYFRYAQALKGLRRYKDADVWMTKLAELNADDSRAASLKYNPEYLKTIDIQSNRYDIFPTSISSKNSEFATGFDQNQGIIFSSDGSQSSFSKRTDAWTGKPFLQLLHANISSDNDLVSDGKVKGSFNDRHNESTAAITKDGNTMYFTRNSYEKGEGYQTDEDGIVRLKIYIASKINGEWGNIVEFPYNNVTYSVAHPTLSKDDNRLYFASDMPGTRGLSDIYFVDINSDGSFGFPQNMGNVVNTEGRDTFPFMANDGTLYFASDGHLGLGGLDVFAVVDPLSPSKDGIFNLGDPVNSESDDFAFIINSDSKVGYFSSNRKSGRGGDDIYRVLETNPLVIECTKEIDGVTTNKKTGDVIPNVNLTVYDSNNDIIQELQSDDKGAFAFELDCKNAESYRVVGEKNDYAKDEQSFTVEPNVELALDLELDLEPVEVGTNLFVALDLNPIYFTYDKSFIREDAEYELQKVIRYMRENPQVKIDVKSHTDSRGRDAYNYRLSNRRNRATIDYIVDEGGISRSRITGQGYGESEILNGCTNDIKCSEDEHQLNRRSEFIIIEK